MGKRTCAECAKCKTAACESPDKCVAGGYKYFSSQPLQNWKYCRECGGPLTLQAVKIETDDIGTEYKICLNCGHKEKVQRACV